VPEIVSRAVRPLRLAAGMVKSSPLTRTSTLAASPNSTESGPGPLTLTVRPLRPSWKNSRRPFASVISVQQSPV